MCGLFAGCAAGLRVSPQALLPDGTTMVVAQYRTYGNAGNGVEAVMVQQYRCWPGPGRPNEHHVHVLAWDAAQEQWRHYQPTGTAVVRCEPGEHMAASGKSLTAGVFVGAGTALIGGAALVGAAGLARPDVTQVEEGDITVGAEAAGGTSVATGGTASAFGLGVGGQSTSTSIADTTTTVKQQQQMQQQQRIQPPVRGRKRPKRPPHVSQGQEQGQQQ